MADSGLPYASLEAPAHLPFADGPWRHRMHVRPLPEGGWIEIGPSYVHDLAERDRILRDHRATALVAAPGSEAAADELLDALLDDLAGHHPGTVAVDGAGADAVVHNLRTGEAHRRSSMHPVELAGRLVQEDLLLLVPGADELVLGCACVCFPSRWDLPSKLGRPLRGIHEPVPRLNDQLGAATDAFLARLTADKPVWRLAWSLIDLPHLHQPAGTRRDPVRHGEIDLATVADAVCLRVERETLRRFPRTGAVLFTIRTTVTPLAWFAAHPSEAARLAAAVRAFPDDVAAYKGVTPVREPVLAWLESAAAGTPR